MKICEKCERKIGNIKYEREKGIYDKEYIYNNYYKRKSVLNDLINGVKKVTILPSK